MDPLLMHDTFMWIRSQLYTDNQLIPSPLPYSIQYQLQQQTLTSLQEALHPSILLYLLSKIIPYVQNEPDMGKIQGDPETVLTVYLNGCKRFGIVHLFPAHIHPIFATNTSGVLSQETSGSSSSSSTVPSIPIPPSFTGTIDNGNFPLHHHRRLSSQADVEEDGISIILQNIIELRIIMEAKYIIHSKNKNGQSSPFQQHNTVFGIPQQPSQAILATVESRLYGSNDYSLTNKDTLSSTDPSFGQSISSSSSSSSSSSTKKTSLALTYTEHCALYSGILTNDITPTGRERLWKWLFLYESQYINNCMNTRSQALAATRRINEARKTVGCNGSSDDQLVLLHMLNSPGHGIVLLRRKLLRALVRHGIPPIYRGRLWANFLGGGDDMDISNYLQENIFYHHRFSSARITKSLTNHKLIEAIKQEEIHKMNTVTSSLDQPNHPINEITVTIPSVSLSTSSSPVSSATHSLIQQTQTLFSLYDRLLLCNSLYLGENLLPCHLLAYIRTVNETLATQSIETLRQNIKEEYRTLVPASSLFPDSNNNNNSSSSTNDNCNKDLFLSVHLTEFIPITNKTVNQINVDLRRTLLNLTPLESSRIHYSSLSFVPSGSTRSETDHSSNYTATSSVAYFQYGYPTDTVPIDNALPHHHHHSSSSRRSSRSSSIDISNDKLSSSANHHSEPFFTVSHIHTSRYHSRFQHILNDVRYHKCYHKLRSNDNNVDSRHSNNTSTIITTDHNPVICCKGSYAQFVQTPTRSSSSPISSNESHATERSSSSTLLVEQKSAVTVNIESIRRVLVAFASYAPEIGYCQGLNWLVSHLLRWVSEPDAFCLLTLLVTNVFSPNTFTDLSGAETDAHVFSEIILSSLPIVVNHFGKLLASPAGIGKSSSASNLQVSPQNSSGVSSYYRDPQPALDMIKSLILKWFVVAFANPFPPSFTDRVWDSVLYEGSKTLFRTALALTRLITPRILAAKTLPDALSIFDRLPIWCKHRRTYIAMFDIWIWPPSSIRNSIRTQLPVASTVPMNPSLKTPLKGTPTSTGSVTRGNNRSHGSKHQRNPSSSLSKTSVVDNGSSTAPVNSRAIQKRSVVPSGRPLSSNVGNRSKRLSRDSSEQTENSSIAQETNILRSSTMFESPSVPFDTKPVRSSTAASVSRTRDNTLPSVRPPPVTSTTLGLRIDRKDIGHGISGAAVSWLLSEHNYPSEQKTSLTDTLSAWTGTVDDFAIETYGTSIDTTFFHHDKLFTHGRRIDKNRIRPATILMTDETKLNRSDTDDDPNSTILSMDSVSLVNEGSISEPNDTLQESLLTIEDDANDNTKAVERHYDDTEEDENNNEENHEYDYNDENEPDNRDDDDDDVEDANDEDNNNDVDDDYIEEEEEDEGNADGDDNEKDAADVNTPSAKEPSEEAEELPGEMENRKITDTTSSPRESVDDSSRSSSYRTSMIVPNIPGEALSTTPLITKKPFAGNIARRYGGRKSTPRNPGSSNHSSTVVPLSTAVYPGDLSSTGLSNRALIARGLVLPNDETVSKDTSRANTQDSTVLNRTTTMDIALSFLNLPSLVMTAGLVWREREYISGLYVRSRRVYVRNMLAQLRLQRLMEDHQDTLSNTRINNSTKEYNDTPSTISNEDLTILPSWLQHRLDCANGERMPVVTDGHIDEEVHIDNNKDTVDSSVSSSSFSGIDDAVSLPLGTTMTTTTRSPAPSGGHALNMDNSNESTSLMNLQPSSKHGVIPLPPNLSSPIRRQGAAMEVGAPKIEPYGKRLRLLSFFYRDPRSLDRLPYNLAMIENYWKSIDIDPLTGIYTAIVDEIRLIPYGKGTIVLGDPSFNEYENTVVPISDIPLSRVFLGPLEATVAYRPEDKEADDNDTNGDNEGSSPNDKPFIPKNNNDYSTTNNNNQQRRRSSLPHTTTLMSFLWGNLTSSTIVSSSSDSSAISPKTGTNSTDNYSTIGSSSNNSHSTRPSSGRFSPSVVLRNLTGGSSNSSIVSPSSPKVNSTATSSSNPVVVIPPRKMKETNTILAGSKVFDNYFYCN